MNEKQIHVIIHIIQFSDDHYNIIMINVNCRQTVHPFGSLCNKSWQAYDYNRNLWVDDPTVTLNCKNKGI